MRDLANEHIMEDPREPQRLSSKVNGEKWVENFLSISSGQELKILDVGCGAGDICKAIASRYSNVQVFGIDYSRAKIEFAKKNCSQLKNVTLLLGDAFKMPFEANTFDFILSRFVFEYLKTPQKLLGEIKRICKSGGEIKIQDLDGQMFWHYPMEQSFTKEVDFVIEYLAKETGFDPLVGRKLYSFFYLAGLEEIEVQVEPYHLYPGKIDDENYRLWKLKLDIIFPKISEALGSETKALQLKEAFLNHLLSDETFTYSNLFTVSGKK